MKMQNKTAVKVQNLHNAVDDGILLNRYLYERIRNFCGRENVPTWQTLKRHDLIIKVGQKVLYEEGFEEEFVVVNTYLINF